MRPRDLEAADGQDRLHRFLDRLLGVEADDIILLIWITCERTSRRQIGSRFPQEQASDLNFLRCRQERDPRATHAQPWASAPRAESRPGARYSRSGLST